MSNLLFVMLHSKYKGDGNKLLRFEHEISKVGIYALDPRNSSLHAQVLRNGSNGSLLPSHETDYMFNPKKLQSIIIISIIYFAHIVHQQQCTNNRNHKTDYKEKQY